MADQYESRYTELMYMGGPYGGSTSRWGQSVFNTTAIGTVSYSQKIPAGSLITGFRYVCEALGAGVTVNVGTISKSTTAATKFFSAANMAAAAAVTWAGVPFIVTEDTDVILTTAGAITAAPVKNVDIVVEYVYRGTSYSQVY